MIFLFIIIRRQHMPQAMGVANMQAVQQLTSLLPGGHGPGRHDQQRLTVMSSRARTTRQVVMLVIQVGGCTMHAGNHCADSKFGSQKEAMECFQMNALLASLLQIHTMHTVPNMCRYACRHMTA